MRIKIAGNVCDEEVIAEPFDIEGVDEKFAVHCAFAGDEYRGRWVATHVAIGHADTIDGAIEAGRKAWAAATPEQITAAKTRAIAVLQARDIQSRSVQ
jgi:hypothetical protein